MNSTLEQIQTLSDERNTLYRMAGKHHLTPDQETRLQAIHNQLPLLWDTYRRELATQRRPTRPGDLSDVDAA